MRNVNEVTILGHVGKTPNYMKTKSADIPLIYFSVATNESWLDKKTGEAKQNTEWHDVKAWGPKAEFAKKAIKEGSLVFIKGRIETEERNFNGKSEKQKKIVADEIIPLGNSKKTKLVDAPDSFPEPGSFDEE